MLHWATTIILLVSLVIAVQPEAVQPEAVQPEAVQPEDKSQRYKQIIEVLIGEVPKLMLSTEVTVTAYSARAEECNEEPWFTADMSLSRVGMLAVSRDIMIELGLNFGDTVVLGSYGVFKVHDRMNKRYYRRVDILMGNKEAAKRFGVKKGVVLTWFR